jgi:hypothetical protein
MIIRVDTNYICYVWQWYQDWNSIETHLYKTEISVWIIYDTPNDSACLLNAYGMSQRQIIEGHFERK